MPSYRFEALNTRGKTERGIIDADSERSARQLLRDKGLLPLSLKAAQTQGKAAGRHLRSSDLPWLTRQLASLLAAHLPLEAALQATQEQAERRKVAELLAGVREQVRQGQSLGQALALYPRDFPEIYTALVEAGEQSGDLAPILERLADYLESRGALRNKILTALIYPAVVTLVAMAIVVFLLSYVVPQIVGAFTQAHQALPWLTRALLALSQMVQDYGLALTIMLILILGVWHFSLQNPSRKQAWHRQILQLPVVGSYALGVEVARFAATLAIMTQGRVPLLLALDTAGRTLANRHLRFAVQNASQRVREGGALASALQAQAVFPPLLIQLVGSGERTGELPAMLERTAKVMSAQLEQKATRLTALLEPLLILLMGGVVLLIVLAIMLPIIEMNQLVQ